ncbi:putative toxin [Spirillospora sp. NPDC052269]
MLTRITMRHARIRALAMMIMLVVAAGLLVAPPDRAARADDTPQTDGWFKSLPTTVLLDTRTGIGQSGNKPVRVPAEGKVTFQATGLKDIPQNGIQALSSNISVHQPSTDGWLGVYASDKPTTVPTAVFNTGKSVTVADFTQVTGSGQVTVENHSSAPVDVSVAANGYFTSTSDIETSVFNAVTPSVLWDSRSGTGEPAQTTPLAPGATVTIDTATRNGLPSLGLASSLALNVMVAQPSASGSLNVWSQSADGAKEPPAFMEFKAGEDASSFALVQVGTSAKLKIHNTSSGTVHVSLSVRGYFEWSFFADWRASHFKSIEPAAVLNTSTGLGVSGGNTQPIPAGGSLSFDAVTADLTEDEARRIGGAALSIKADAEGSGFASVYSGGSSDPQTPTLSFSNAGSSAGFELIKPGDHGQVVIANHTSKPLHVQVVARGYMIHAPPPLPEDPYGDGERLTEAGTELRQDRCYLGRIVHSGGPQMKAFAGNGLAGSDSQLKQAAGARNGANQPLDAAHSKDMTAFNTKRDQLSGKPAAWAATAQRSDVTWPGTSKGPNPPSWVTDARASFYDEKFWTVGNDIWTGDVMPLASKDSLTAAVDLAKQLKLYKYSDQTPETARARRAWESIGDYTWMDNQVMQGNHHADDIRLFLQYGGFPTTRLAPGTAEFRNEVESLKLRYAACESLTPADPYHAMADAVKTAGQEWKGELDAQAAQRNAIVASEAKAAQALETGSDAMIEAVGQSWIAYYLASWQSAWSTHKPTEQYYPTAATFTYVKDQLAKAKTAAQAQLAIANKAATDASAEASKVVAAQDAAGKIATTNGTPYGRGLSYALQSAQVTKASAAAAAAAAKATETAFNATNASVSDAATLEALAKTQAQGLATAFRKAAAQEAAAQAKAAAKAAAERADDADQAAARAKTDMETAQAAEAKAKAGADKARNQRIIAQQQRVKAAEYRKVAADERAKAQSYEAQAQQQQSLAAQARATAQSAADTAADKEADANNAADRARTARDQALEAERNRDATQARAKALEANAAAAQGREDAGDAREAANQARTAADQATSAASAARDAANKATAAAVAARAAADKATAAAERARAAADQATDAAMQTQAASLKAHAAAADAITQAARASADVKAAEVLVIQANQDAAIAKNEAAAAKDSAGQALVEANNTAGQALATAQWAAAARDSAAAVADPANQAIALGTAFTNDTSAGLAVLTGQSAKTIAEQQQTAAEARSADADKAAATAKAVADKAAADAKEAAQAASEAAADAASAAKSLVRAKAAAARAHTYAKAAIQADVNAARYNAQAQADAAVARAAATDAETDAAAARNDATAAERDAAGARAAANAAEADASLARQAAVQADLDATSAEESADAADTYAQQAEAAADRTEEQMRQQERRDALQGGGPELTGDEEAILRAKCGQKCVDEYKAALANANLDIASWLKTNGGDILLEIIGVNDVKRCLGQGDTASCLWSIVDVASLVMVAGKLPKVAEAIAKVVGGIHKVMEASAAARRTLDSFQTIIRTERACGLRPLSGPGAGAVLAATSCRVVFDPEEIHRLGLEGESAVSKILGVAKNTRQFPSASGRAAHRIPDFLDHANGKLVEVKNVRYMYLSSQLKDDLEIAKSLGGYKIQLWVRETTQLSGPLKELVRSGQIELEYLP